MQIGPRLEGEDRNGAERREADHELSQRGQPMLEIEHKVRIADAEVVDEIRIDTAAPHHIGCDAEGAIENEQRSHCPSAVVAESGRRHALKVVS